MNDSGSDIPDLVDTSTDDDSGFPCSGSFGKSLVKCAEDWNARTFKFKQQQEANIKIFALAPFLFHVDDLLPKTWITAALKIKESFSKSSDEDFSDDIIDFVETVIEKVFEFMNSIFCDLDVVLDMVQKVNGFAVQNSSINLDLLSDTLNNSPTVMAIWTFVLSESVTSDKEKEAQFLTFYVLKHYYEVVVGVCREGKDVVKEKRNLHECNFDAAEYRIKGNEEFHKCNFKKAVEWYSKSAEASPFNHIYYGNRGQAYFKMKNFRKALEDGRRAIILKPDWPKGQYRYAEALYKLGELQKAIQANQRAIEICSISCTDTENVKILYDQKIRFDEEVSGIYSSKEPCYNCIDQEEKQTQTNVTEEEINTATFRENHNLDEDEISDEVPDLISSETDDTDEEEFVKSGEEQTNDTAVIPSEVHDYMDDVPGLTSSDTDEEIEKQHVQRSRQKKSRKSAKVKAQDDVEIPVGDTKSTEDEGTRARNLMTEGSIHYMKGSAMSAISYYQRALDIISSADLKKCEMDIEDLVLLKFVIGLAAACTKNYKTILEGLEKLRSILSIHCEVSFPQAFYGIGKSYIVLNRFDQAVDPLTEGLKCITSEKTVKEYTFPGMNDKFIKETQRSHVKELLEDSLELCRFPPTPDAVCKYHTTEESRRVIYFTDPDFKGFVRVTCDSTCVIEFHIICWKNYRNEIGNKVRDKDVLNTQCPTPDCQSVIIKITIYKPDSTVKEFNSEKVLTSKNPSKNMKPAKQQLSSEAKKKKVPTATLR